MRGAIPRRRRGGLRRRCDTRRLGVFAEPELSSQPLTEADRFIVLASDGVFEFLTTQAVVDMVAKFESPLDACAAVVAEAYQLWLPC